jgi:hypothetical protein
MCSSRDTLGDYEKRVRHAMCTAMVPDGRATGMVYSYSREQVLPGRTWRKRLCGSTRSLTRLSGATLDIAIDHNRSVEVSVEQHTCTSARSWTLAHTRGRTMVSIVACVFAPLRAACCVCTILDLAGLNNCGTQDPFFAAPCLQPIGGPTLSRHSGADTLSLTPRRLGQLGQQAQVVAWREMTTCVPSPANFYPNLRPRPPP